MDHLAEVSLYLNSRLILQSVEAWELVYTLDAQHGFSTDCFSLFQISPFPLDLIRAEHQKYDNAEIVWAQEEPQNMGYWTYVQPRLVTSVGNKVKISYAGRPPSASTATGNKHHHNSEQEDLINQALD